MLAIFSSTIGWGQAWSDHAVTRSCHCYMFVDQCPAEEMPGDKNWKELTARKQRHLLCVEMPQSFTTWCQILVQVPTIKLPFSANSFEPFWHPFRSGMNKRNPVPPTPQPAATQGGSILKSHPSKSLLKWTKWQDSVRTVLLFLEYLHELQRQAPCQIITVLPAPTHPEILRWTGFIMDVSERFLDSCQHIVVNKTAATSFQFACQNEKLWLMLES